MKLPVFHLPELQDAYKLAAPYLESDDYIRNRIVEDIETLETYLQGLRSSKELTFEDLTWGPLGHKFRLHINGKPLAEQKMEIRLKYYKILSQFVIALGEACKHKS